MRITKNLKSILILFAIVAVFFAWEYYQNKKNAKELIARFEQKDCLITLDGYKFGITKEEFDKLYPVISESVKYSKSLGYIDTGRIIKNFHGIDVKQTQFTFSNYGFSGAFSKTSFFTAAVFNLANVTNNDIIKLRTIFTNSDFDGKEYFNGDDSLNYRSQYFDLNDCITVYLSYEPSKNTGSIGFEIKEEIIYPY